jgi:hypothetical protein
MAVIKRGMAAFIAGRAARLVLRGALQDGNTDPTEDAITDLLVSNLVVREDAANGIVGYIYAVGGGVVSFTLVDNAGGVFAILNGNELHKVDDFDTGADDSITIRATSSGGGSYDEVFTIDVIPTEDEVNDPGISGGGDVIVPDPTDPDDDGYTLPPVQIDTEVGLTVSGKNGGTTSFLKDWGVPEAGKSYVMRYQADWSGMSQQGRYAAVGFGFKSGNNFHMAALRGNGSVITVMLASRIYGQFNKSKNYTITNDGVAENGTRTGPNWLKLDIAEDGENYTLSSSGDDGETWDVEIEDVLPAPLAAADDATVFGPAGYFYAEDKGTFVITITEFVEASSQSLLLGADNLQLNAENLTLSTASGDVDVASPGADEAVLTAAVLARATPLRVKVRKAAPQTTANYTSGVTVAWDAEDYDVGGWHDNVTNNTRLTVPSGVTRVDIEVALVITEGSGSIDTSIEIHIDGASLNRVGKTRQFHTGAAMYDHLLWTDVSVTAGQYITAVFIVTSDTSVTITTDCFLSAVATAYSQ